MKRLTKISLTVAISGMVMLFKGSSPLVTTAIAQSQNTPQQQPAESTRDAPPALRAHEIGAHVQHLAVADARVRRHRPRRPGRAAMAGQNRLRVPTSGVGARRSARRGCRTGLSAHDYAPKRAMERFWRTSGRSVQPGSALWFSPGTRRAVPDLGAAVRQLPVSSRRSTECASSRRRRSASIGQGNVSSWPSLVSTAAEERGAIDIAPTRSAIG